MIRLIGEIALVFALFFSLTQSVLPLYGYYRHNPYLLACARVSCYAQAVFVFAAYLLITIAFAMNDFSIAYVAANSHASLPLMYRLTAVWGAHEGSILLWIVILNIWTLIYSFTQKNNATLAIAILGLISFCFLCFLLLTSNPFLANLTLSTGEDLNPLLQDPGFIIHPPMLYFGYVGFSVAFAITQAALLQGHLDKAWALVTRQYALAAWCFLTLGITLGSWWAYRVLGWGGFWFWDPVENASLLPWLSGTALIHVLMLVEKRNIANGFAALLALISFALSLLGTFLVRSGVLISAHTFANDPARGVFLLILLAIITTTALSIYLWRLSSLPKTKNLSLFWLSRETGLLLNSALMLVAMTTILLGTLYPLLLDALSLGTISVGAPYFNTVMMPLAFIIMASMGIAVLCAWQKQSITALKKQLLKKISISMLCALVLLWGTSGYIHIIAALSLSLSFFIILSTFRSLRIQPGMSLAHMGFAILIIGVLLSSLLNQERQVRLQIGDMVKLGPYQFFFLDTKGINGANYHGIRATFEVLKNTHHVSNLYPEKRIFNIREMVMTKVDIHPGIFRDLYIALGEPYADNDWSVRIYYKPFVRWIWCGGILMMLGGLLAMLKITSSEPSP